MKDAKQDPRPDRDPSLARVGVDGPAVNGDSVPITVNGEQYVVSPPELTREELVTLLYPNIEPGGRAAMTVSYHRGPASAPSGFLHARERIKVVPQQTFNVALTVRS